jgi:hypothetical protein
MNSPHALDLADGWKRRCLPALVALVALAAVIALSVYFLGAVLCAYSQSHYDYLARVPAVSSPADSA